MKVFINQFAINTIYNNPPANSKKTFSLELLNSLKYNNNAIFHKLDFIYEIFNSPDKLKMPIDSQFWQLYLLENESPSMHNNYFNNYYLNANNFFENNFYFTETDSKSCLQLLLNNLKNSHSHYKFHDMPLGLRLKRAFPPLGFYSSPQSEIIANLRGINAAILIVEKYNKLLNFVETSDDILSLIISRIRFLNRLKNHNSLYKSVIDVYTSSINLGYNSFQIKAYFIKKFGRNPELQKYISNILKTYKFGYSDPIQILLYEYIILKFSNKMSINFEIGKSLGFKKCKYCMKD